MTESPYTPHANWEGAASRKLSGAPFSFVTGMVVGGVIFAVGCGGGLVAGWFGSTGRHMYRGGYMTAESVNASLFLDYPASVKAGEEFDIVVAITDTSGQDRNVNSIGFDGAVCEELEYLAISPNGTGLNTYYGYREFALTLSVPASNASQAVVHVRAPEAGTIEGGITIYFDNIYEPLVAPISITVEPPEAYDETEGVSETEAGGDPRKAPG